MKYVVSGQQNAKSARWPKCLQPSLVPQFYEMLPCSLSISVHFSRLRISPFISRFSFSILETVILSLPLFSSALSCLYLSVSSIQPSRFRMSLTASRSSDLSVWICDASLSSKLLSVQPSPSRNASSRWRRAIVLSSSLDLIYSLFNLKEDSDKAAKLVGCVYLE